MKKAGTLLKLQGRSQAIYYRDECENCLQCALLAPLNPHLFVSGSTRDQNNASTIVANKMNQIQN